MYKLQFTDTNKEPLIIEDRDLNYDTSLVLFGRDTEDWGTYLNSNFIHLLEHFSNEFPPGYTGQILEGQLWFDSYNKQLKVCISSKELIWNALCNVESEPVEDVVLYDELDNLLSDYIKLSGGEFTGQLLVDYPVDKFDVANKKYIDQLICACQDANVVYGDYVTLSGGKINTKIYVSDSTDKRSAAHSSYVSSKKKIAVSGADNITVGVGGSKNEFIYTRINSVNSHIYCHGSISMPKVSAECIITLPKELQDDFFIICHGKDADGKDIEGTSDLGKICDVYCKIIDNKSFSVHRTNTEYDAAIYITIFGVEK